MVAVVVAVVAGGGVVAFALRPSHRSRGARAGAAVTPLELAERTSVRPVGLPSRWTQCCKSRVLTGAQLGQHICGAAANLPPHVAGYERQYSLDLQRDRSEAGHLVSTVVVAPSAQAAAAELAAVNAPGYPQCTVASVQQDALAGIRQVLGAPATALTSRSPGAFGAPGLLERYVTSYQTQSGRGVVYSALLRLRIGRVLVRVDLLEYDAPAPFGTLEGIAHSAIVHAQGAPAAD